VAEEIDLEMCSYGQLSKVQMLCDLDLGSGQSHISIHSMCRTTSTPKPCDSSITQYRNMAIWMSWNIDIRRSLNSPDSFPRRKFENRVPISCSPGPILSSPIMSFEFHAKTVEEIDLEKCNFRNFGRSVTLTLTLTLDRVEVTLVCMCGGGLPTPN